MVSSTITVNADLANNTRVLCRASQMCGTVHVSSTVSSGTLSFQDIDECDRDLDNCDVLATCMNTVGSYDCMCIAGYEGSGSNQDCRNIDECARDTDNCNMNATCTDTEGSFFCACLDGFRGNGIICAEIGTLQNSNGSLVIVISVSVPVGVLVIILIIVGVLIVRRRKKLTHDNHIYESVSLYALEMQYNITSNDAYVPGTSASTDQQNVANTERQSSTASHCSYEAVEGDEMRDGDEQPGSEHEQDASVCYQAGDDYEQAQCYELAGGVYDKFRGQDYEQTSDPYERVQDYEQQQASDTYDQFRGQDYEQTSDPYERVQDYEQQQASGVYDQLQSYERLQLSDPYDQVQSYERLQLSDPYDQIQSYERLQVSDRVGDTEQLQATDQVQSYEQPQAHTVYHIQGYELVVQSRYCGLIQLQEI